MFQVDRFVSHQGYARLTEYTPEVDDLDTTSTFPLLKLSERAASLVLGEPGAGKSTALRRLQQLLTESGQQARLIDLSDCYTEAHVERAFDEAALEVDAAAGQRILLIDSIDEAPGLIRKRVRFLERRLTTLQNDGWRLIAMCRTAESIRDLDEVFETLDDNAVYVLLPLRRSDVLEIADAAGITPAPFVEQLERRRLDSLAAIPFTLSLLCRVYQSDSQFPTSRADVFERAIALILAEQSIDGYSPLLSDSVGRLRQRLAAERLAAFSAIAEVGGFGLVRPGEETTGVLTELLLGPESSDGVTFELDNEDFQRVLRTPLFAASGSNERQFIHRQLRDWLAARFLIRHDVSLAQLQSTLMVTDGAATIPPQMVDIATWLVSMAPERFAWILSADPFSLVRNRLADDAPGLAGRLVTEMLDRAYEVERLLSWRDDLTGLGYVGLSEVLRAALSMSESEQIVAMRILKDSYVPGLEDELLGIVGDVHRGTRVRELALRIMAERGLHDQLRQVNPHVPGFFDADSDAELRGTVLDAMWPDYMSADQVLGLLVKPPEHLFGNYSLAIHRLERDLDASLSHALLTWTNPIDLGDSGSRGRGRELRKLVDRAIAFAAAETGLGAETETSLIHAIARRIEQSRHKLPLKFAELPPGQLRRLTSGMVSCQVAGAYAWYSLLMAADEDGVPLLNRDDVPWMADQADGATSVDEFSTWSKLIDRFLDSERTEDFEWAWEQRHRRVWGALRYRFEGLELNSDRAREARENWSLINLHGNQDSDNVEPREMTGEEYVATVRDVFANTHDQPHLFWFLCRWLDVDLKTRRYNFNREPDLLRLPGLDLLGDSGADDILTLAANFIASRPPLPPRPKANTIYYQMRATYQALHTLAVHRPEKIDDLAPSELTRFAPSLFDFPLGAGDEPELVIRRDLLRRTHAADQIAFAKAIKTYFSKTSRGQANSTSFRELADLLDPSAIPSLRRAIRSAKSHDRSGAFNLYIGLDPSGARRWASNRILRSTDPDESGAILGVLLDEAPEFGYDLLQQLVDRGHEVAERALLSVAGRERYGQRAFHKVPPQTRVRMFETLADLFPPAEDIFETGMHAVTPREDLADWRRGLLNSVISGGSREGVLALIGLNHSRPEFALEWAIVAARESHRLGGWRPLARQEFRAVLDDSGTHLVRSSSDLMTLVLAALDEIQRWLTGETPQSFVLWDVAPKYRSPKDENRISDWYCHSLRVILDRSGLIINREVEVSNVSGRGVGRRQDIRIEVKDPLTGELYVVVVEVKGLWNSGVKTNLTTQLVDDYLIGGHLTHGVYLVLMFSHTGMEGVDGKAAAARRNRRNLSVTLEAQAASASPAVSVVPVLHCGDLPA